MSNPEYRKALLQGIIKKPRQLPAEDALLAERIILLKGPIDDDSAEVVVMKLLYLASENRRRPIELLIDSHGGMVSSSLAIIDTIHRSAPPVHTHCIGHAHGAAAIILAVGAPGNRRVSRKSQLSLTEVSANEDVSVAEEELVKTSHVLKEILAKATGRSEEAIGISMLLKDRLDAQAAVDIGLADLVVDDL